MRTLTRAACSPFDPPALAAFKLGPALLLVGEYSAFLANVLL
jgi:hypothetical protein